ncbi:hypothetical protein GCM10009641_61740 [Mycobacterium cookii]|uniref:Thioesterase domain-containing protein n=1 Tax=Nocardioides furvisabuli TaxID=375542 RepID=A0ABP5IWY4_9ACTN|nr:hypothetical protein [Nocardioides furvisabuli]
MSTTDCRERTSNSVVVTPSDCPLGVSEVLRTFDACRRELSKKVAGTEGSGAGYDGLRVDHASLAAVSEGDVVTVTAIVSSRRHGGHLVDYIATASNAGGRCVVLVQAHGWTLARQTTESVAGVRRRSHEEVRS